MIPIIEQLEKFLQSDFSNQWLSNELMKEVYVRKSHRRLSDVTYHCLDIANVHVFLTGQGTFTRFLAEVIEINPFQVIYVENVLTNRFANWFRKNNWIEIPALAPSFYLIKT